MGLSVKGARSKRTARGGTRANGDDKVTKGSDLQQLLKQGHSESTDTDTESGSARRRGRKPNSLMNPEEGYSFKTSSGKNDSSRGKLAGKKAPSPSKVAQTNQPVVISLSPSSKSRKKGSGKRSRSKMEETDLDAASLARPVSKKPTVKKDEPEEEDLMETDIEKPEDGIKTAKPSKKEKKAENGSAKTSAKKPLEESKTSGKKIVHSEAKKNNSKTDIPQSSKSKVLNLMNHNFFNILHSMTPPFILTYNWINCPEEELPSNNACDQRIRTNSQEPSQEKTDSWRGSGVNFYLLCLLYGALILSRVFIWCVFLFAGVQ